jgi:hypothetical protein
MIKGRAPSVINQNNTLIVSKINDSTFEISKGIIYVGGHSIFFEGETLRTDSLSFPFRIGIEIEGLPDGQTDVKTYNIAKAGSALKPADIPTYFKQAPTPDGFSSLKAVPVGYNFDNRKVKNAFKSLAIVEQVLESIITTQHSYGPLSFEPIEISSYKEDFIAFTSPGGYANVSYYTIPDKLFLK